jgi:hypothetical protein
MSLYLAPLVFQKHLPDAAVAQWFSGFVCGNTDVFVITFTIGVDSWA